MIDNLRKEIAHLIVEMSVNSTDLRPFPLNTILKAMSECKVRISDKYKAKKQALEIIKELEKVLPIKRARMRIQVTFENGTQVGHLKSVMSTLFEGEYEIEKE